MSINHRYASCCLEVISRLANQWGIMLPEGATNLTPFRSAGLNQAAPNMSLFFTQATLSNETIDALVAPSNSIRHDSGSIFEPSFVPHNMPILPSRPTSGSQHSMHSTPMQTTPVQTQSNVWTPFPPQQQLSNPGMQLQMPVADFQMMNVDHSNAFQFQNFQPNH